MTNLTIKVKLNKTSNMAKENPKKETVLGVEVLKHEKNWKADEQWTLIRLEDGTTLRMKLVILDVVQVKSAIGEKNAYMVKTQNVLLVDGE